MDGRDMTGVSPRGDTATGGDGAVRPWCAVCSNYTSGKVTSTALPNGDRVLEVSCHGTTESVVVGKEELRAIRGYGTAFAERGVHGPRTPWGAGSDIPERPQVRVSMHTWSRAGGVHPVRTEWVDADDPRIKAIRDRRKR
jgi:hypothetical protein